MIFQFFSDKYGQTKFQKSYLRKKTLIQKCIITINIVYRTAFFSDIRKELYTVAIIVSTLHFLNAVN